MKLKCTIGTQVFVGGPTYSEGDEYELEDEKLANEIIEWGDAEEVKEVTSPVTPPSSIEMDKSVALPLKEDSPNKDETPKKRKTGKKF